MTIESADSLAQQLRELKQRRKEGSLPLKEYYRQILGLMGTLAASLQEEVGSLAEEEIAYQIPVVLLFLEEQIRKFGERTHP